MNKQELIEKIDNLQYSLSWNIPRINKEIVINLIEQLDEPQKPVVPQFVAEWIEKNKGSLFGLNYDSVSSKIYDWVYEEEGNLKKLHLACAIGYTVEERKYTVKVKATLGQYLGRYYLNNEDLTPQFTRTQFTGKEKLPTFTRKELEEAGFGWVFDCEGIEIEEVE